MKIFKFGKYFYFNYFSFYFLIFFRFLAGVAEMGPENHQEVADLEAATYYLTHAKEMIEEKVQTHQVI